MFITDKTWDEIRDQFSEQEKSNLRKYVTGESICPKGIIVDEYAMTKELSDKLIAAKKGIL